MFKRLFGGVTGLDRSSLAKLLFGKNINDVQRWGTSFTIALMQQIDESNIVEQSVSDTDSASGGDKLIRGRVIQLLCGGPSRIGFPNKNLTPSQSSAAERISRSIADSRTGELFSAANAAATTHAMSAWYTERYADSISIATHILSNLDPNNGEAYRIRAFAHIMLGDLKSAREDLRAGIRVMPTISGAKEPLEAVEQTLNSR